jgi:tRNA pseudouridine55 synthase
VVDKPGGMTSHDVVNRIRRLAGTRRVGHAGTLDPMATGVLVLGVERATKLLHHLTLTDKSYLATISLGVGTTTDDADGELVEAYEESGLGSLGSEKIQLAMRSLTGSIMQRPATVSAIKIDGRRAYDLARRGEAPQLAERPVVVRRFELTGGPRRGTAFGKPSVDLDVAVECSSGTYIRALARDLGARLGIGAHLRSLRRTSVGPFRIEAAFTLEQLAAAPDPLTLPLADAIAHAMPVRSVTAEQTRELSFGRPIDVVGLAGTYGAIGPAGEAVALLTEDAGRARPILCFTPAG